MTTLNNIIKEAIEIVDQSDRMVEAYQREVEKFEQLVKEGKKTRYEYNEVFGNVRTDNYEFLKPKQQKIMNDLAEFKDSELDRLNSEISKVEDSDFNELLLLKEVDYDKELLQKYVDKYKYNELALKYLEKLASKDKENIIVLDIPQKPQEFLNIITNRIENYVMQFVRPDYSMILPQFRMHVSGAKEGMLYDYNRYLSLINKASI